MLCLYLIFSQAAHAQSRIPPKDIAILADVSASVRKDFPRHEEARELIIKLATGERIDWSLSHWTADITTDPQLLGLFGQALGRTDQSEPPAPLTTAGHNLLVLHVGKLTTVNGPHLRRPIPQLDRLPEMIRSEYPEEKDIRDQSTCFWYAMARAAKVLGDEAPQGYYLFVVSDEEDDPDYLPDGPPGHSVQDYHNYLKYTAAQYPLSTIQQTIQAWFQQVPGRLGKGAYVPRDDFLVIRIARFNQKSSTLPENRKVHLSWYAMGVKPVPVVPVAVTALTPPVFRPAIALLGGLKSTSTGEPRVYDYVNPRVIWQLPFGEANGLTREQFALQTVRGQTVAIQAPAPGDHRSSRPNGPKTGQLPIEQDSAKAFYRVAPFSQEAPTVDPAPFALKVVLPKEWILPLLALLSGVSALGLLIWAWFSCNPRSPLKRLG